MRPMRITIGILLLWGVMSNMNTVHAKLSRSVLINGITFIAEESHVNRIVSIRVFLKMGGLYETDEQAGLSSLMQDCLTKGTRKRTAEQIAIELENVGARLGASASREYGEVSLMCTSETLEKCLPVLFDVLTEASFPPDLIEAAKKTAIQRIHERSDRPISRAVDLMVEAHYGSHPFHKPSMGYEETVAKFSRDDLINFYHAFYVPNNMIFSCVGDFNTKKLKALVKKFLGTLEKKDLPQPDLPLLPERREPIESVEEKEGQAAWFTISYDAPSYKDSDFFTMEVMDGITGGSMNSRLFTELRDKRGLAYQVSSVYVPRMGPSLYFCYMGTSPDQYEEAKKLLLAELDRMYTEKVTEEELRLSKTYLRGMHIMAQESNGGRASLYGRFELIGLGTSFIEGYIKGLEKVSREEIQRVAKEVIIPAYTLGAVLPPQ